MSKINVFGKEIEESEFKKTAETIITKNNPSVTSTDLDELVADMIKTMHDMEKADEILKMLEIPVKQGRVDSDVLVAILMDDEKLNKLVSKLKNKAFW